MLVVVEIKPGRPSGPSQLGPMFDGGVDLLPVDTILSRKRGESGVDLGREPWSFAGLFFGPFDPTLEGVRHEGFLCSTRNGLSNVNASGLTPFSMRAQVTGAAIGKDGRARGE